MNWDNVINKINKRLQSIAAHMGVDSSLYSRYAALIDMGLEYDYRSDGTIRIKRNKANLDPEVYQMQIYKQLLDLDTYQDMLNKAKDKLEENQDDDYMDEDDFLDEDDEYTDQDLLQDMDYVEGHIDEAFEIMYQHMIEGTTTDADIAFMDATSERRHDISHRELAYLIRKVIENA